jgi:hypothetical protein
MIPEIYTSSEKASALAGVFAARMVIILFFALLPMTRALVIKRSRILVASYTVLLAWITWQAIVVALAVEELQ